MCFAEVSTVPLVYCHGKFHWNCFAIAQELRWFGEKIAPPGRDSSHVFVFFKGPIHPLTLLWVVSCTNQFSSYVWSLQIYRIYIYTYIYTVHIKIYGGAQLPDIIMCKKNADWVYWCQSIVGQFQFQNTVIQLPGKMEASKMSNDLNCCFHGNLWALFLGGGLAFKGYLPLDSHDVCFDMFLLLEI